MPDATLTELSRLFLKLGTFGFGGPAAHIATMEEEVVQRKGWLTQQEFLDLVGATNLIPGPNSTELAIHIGYQQGGWRGLLVAGSCFLFPAILITGLFAWAYVEYGHLPQTAPLMAGIQPAVLAVILVAGWRLGKKALSTNLLKDIAFAVALASLLLPGQAILILAVSSLLGTLLLKQAEGPSATPPPRKEQKPKAGNASSPMLLSGGSLAIAQGTAAGGPGVWALLTTLGSIFLKVGAVLYGSGYLLIAYLEGELVHQRGLLTADQLVDAIAIGQFTPGPILSTATFIGYVVVAEAGYGPLARAGGALVTTFAIFLPAFLLVGITSRWVAILRSHRTLAKFLDAVNAASMGLMAAVVIKLTGPTLFLDVSSAELNHPANIGCRLLIAGLAGWFLFRYRMSPILIIAGGLLLGALLGHWLV